MQHTNFDEFLRHDMHSQYGDMHFRFFFTAFRPLRLWIERLLAEFLTGDKEHNNSGRRSPSSGAAKWFEILEDLYRSGSMDESLLLRKFTFCDSFCLFFWGSLLAF